MIEPSGNDGRRFANRANRANRAIRAVAATVVVGLVLQVVWSTACVAGIRLNRSWPVVRQYSALIAEDDAGGYCMATIHRGAVEGVKVEPGHAVSGGWSSLAMPDQAERSERLDWVLHVTVPGQSVWRKALVVRSPWRGVEVRSEGNTVAGPTSSRQWVVVHPWPFLANVVVCGVAALGTAALSGRIRHRPVPRPRSEFELAPLPWTV